MWFCVGVFLSVFVILTQAQLGEISVAPLGHRNVPTGAKTYKTEKAPTSPRQVNPYLINFSQLSNLLREYCYSKSFPNELIMTLKPN